MNIVKVSMIGANENLPVQDIVDFLHAYPMAEIGVGVSRGKGACGTPRFDYVMSLLHEYNAKYIPGKTGTVALHINGNGKDGADGWPAVVSRGGFPASLITMMCFPNMSIQLNHLGYDFAKEGAQCLAESYFLWQNSRLILSYCSKTADYVRAFMTAMGAKSKHDLKWDILYDASFGGGKMAQQYAAPLYPGIRQGYAGGLGPDNIEAELEKIRAVQINQNAEIWIDAEGKLRNQDKKTLDLAKAEQFYKKIMAFQKRHGGQLGR